MNDHNEHIPGQDARGEPHVVYLWSFQTPSEPELGCASLRLQFALSSSNC